VKASKLHFGSPSPTPRQRAIAVLRAGQVSPNGSLPFVIRRLKGASRGYSRKRPVPTCTVLRPGHGLRKAQALLWTRAPRFRDRFQTISAGTLHPPCIDSLCGACAALQLHAELPISSAQKTRKRSCCCNMEYSVQLHCSSAPWLELSLGVVCHALPSALDQETRVWQT
jgi:hypothetical protein